MIFDAKLIILTSIGNKLIYLTYLTCHNWKFYLTFALALKNNDNAVACGYGNRLGNQFIVV
jgi:hypothetical protein